MGEFNLNDFETISDEELRYISGGDFAGSLKHHRIEAGMTQSNLAELLYVDTHTIRNWECRRTHPKGPDIYSLCQLFNIEFNTLWDAENHYR